MAICRPLTTKQPLMLYSVSLTQHATRNFIYTHLSSKTFHVPIFTKLTHQPVPVAARSKA